MTNKANGVYIEASKLSAYGESTARLLAPDSTESSAKISADVRRALRGILSSHDALKLKWQDQVGAPGAVHWLLDNHYLARREGLSAAQALSDGTPLRFSKGECVLLSLCTAFLRSGECELSIQRLEAFLQGFQKLIILSRAELSLLITALRAALVLELDRACKALSGSKPTDGIERTFSHIFSSLRFLGTADLTSLLENADYIEQTLRRDPSGVYPLMDEETRGHYRRRVEDIAKRRGVSEFRVAKRILALSEAGSGKAAHVGYHLYVKPLGGARRLPRGGLYISGVSLSTLVVSLFVGFWLESVWSALLLLVPVSEIIKSVTDFIILRLQSPAQLPRLALENGTPDDGKALCVISSILSGEGDGRELAKSLEEHKLANLDAGKNLLFAVLSDFPESKEEEIEGSCLWLQNAKNAIDELNKAYGGGFFLFTRARCKSPEGRFMGRERKRGAIEDLMQFLRGGKTSLYPVSGDAQQLCDTRFLITLDSDTRLNPGSARQLIGAMLHPLNRPVVDEKRRIVKAGHAIITPRISVDLPSSIKSDFARVFAGQGGTDPYCGVCGSVYMDLWGLGGYSGKGIIDIDAYLACMPGRIAENRVLSHDSLEGAYLSGTELSDSFPSGALSFYKRLHRWVRGDWQNLPWLFSRGRELCDIERWKIFDGARRSLFPISAFFSIFLCFFIPTPSFFIAAWTAIFATALQLVLVAVETLFQKNSQRRIRYHSTLYHGIGGGLVGTVLKLILLPIEAYFCLDAICKALWRMMVSKKNLLLWQTAQQSDSAGRGFLKYLAAMYPVYAVSLLALFLSPLIIGKAVCFIWLLSPLCAYVLSISHRDSDTLSGEDGEFLISCAKEIWAYFEEFCSEEDNFLPPDNFQSRPPVGIAHRTSPTNIGLAILSCIAAIDLGIAEREKALYIISRCLDTIERLPKWHGHLYNWYDTRTLEPLHPAYVSTVDSGNFYACLVAARAALCEYEREDLAARFSAIMDSMDFSPLYDKCHKLFYIGIDIEKNEASSSFYDLMASEAMLSGFIAIAKGDVPRDHWRRLSHALMQKNGYRGMASWTGTMFEYLMPSLLLPIYRDSLIYESAKFCVYVQKHRTAKEGAPWGASESAFFSLDAGMCYRYKAHGCGAASLKRGMDDELVISPYSSFLALAVSPKSAVKNLRRLEALGMRGPYCFWEALDFTKSRRTKGKPSHVRCVMSHHAGMSMVAAANRLSGNVFQRRFMSDARMSAHRGLLQEKVPIGGAVLQRHKSQTPEKPDRTALGVWQASREGIDFLNPKCCLLSNSIYSVMLTEIGHCIPQWGAVSPYVSLPEKLGHDKGINLAATCDGEILSLLPCPGTSGKFSTHFSAERAEFFGSFGSFQSRVSAFLAADYAAEIRKIKLSNSSATEKSFGISLSFKPLLAEIDDYVNHPAFYELGMSARLVHGALLIRRLPRGKNGEIFMCLACDRPLDFHCIAGADAGRARKRQELREAAVWLCGETIFCEASLSLESGADASLCFALSAAHSEEEALDAARRSLAADDADLASFPETAATVIGMDCEDFGSAWDMLTDLVFQKPPRGKDFERDKLWRFGISGDLPIVCAEFKDIEHIERARELMNKHLLITGCGLNFDLIFITFDGASYQKPLSTTLSDALWRSGGEALFASPGGVHIIEDGEGTDAIKNAAASVISLGASEKSEQRSIAPIRLLKASLPTLCKGGTLKYEWGRDGEFSFAAQRTLPLKAWSNMLTNGRFSYIAADCGMGNMWFLNSRENQISPWLCQPLATDGVESIMLTQGDESRSLFAAADDATSRVSYGFGYAVWEREIFGLKVKTTAFVPPDIDARVMIIECDSQLENAFLHWQLDLVMSTSKKDARYTITTFQDGVFSAANSRAIAQAKPFHAVFDRAPEQFTCERDMALLGTYDGHAGACAEPVFAARLAQKSFHVLVCGCAEPGELRSLSTLDGAKTALSETKKLWQKKMSALWISCDSANLSRITNGWATYQTLACRIMGRGSIYQSGGAFGFRDQLQDTANLIELDSSICREQILRSCARQYLEGDVQHWWHEGESEIRGVRTRCSDDLLWLPWALCEYSEKTGNLSLCATLAPFIASPPLGERERERYEKAQISQTQKSVFEHCELALSLVLARGVGSHGLLRFGSGDWNDGMDAVFGESQWLTWFFVHTATRFAALANRFSPGSGDGYKKAADSLAAAANEAWDGRWFLRGYFENGKPLGSAQCAQCRIDSIAQSFSVFCEQSDKNKADTALGSALDQLFDRKRGIVKLFDPPFLKNENHPGYIESYGPGFRENGGQYTHAALWLSMALFRAGRADDGYEVLEALLPAGKDISTYLAEPYVIAADVYTAPGHEGEAGWSWYTGSSGWALRIITQELLGITLRDGKVFIKPNLPQKLQKLRVFYRGLDIEMRGREIWVNGSEYHGEALELL